MSSPTDEFNPRQLEGKWSRRWTESKAFESQPESGKNKYFLTVPYPYASGALHVGHARSYTLGDVTARYMRMLGFNVLFPMASHITGTPILAISRKIEHGDEKALAQNREYVSYYESDSKKIDAIVAGFAKPENVASYYANAIKSDFRSMGYTIDWRRFFTTGDKAYNAFIRWQYHHLNRRGFLVKGKHPVYYCPGCGNPVTTDDIKSGDEYSIEMSQFYLLKEPFEDGFIVAATLRPETIFGVVNVWINPKEKYVKAEVDSEIWYVAEKFVEKLLNQQHKVKILETFEGNNLLKKKIRIPLADREVPLLPAGFVDASIATGVVNSVPAHAPYDYVAGEEIMAEDRSLDLTPIPLIKIDGFSAIPAKDLVEREGIKSQTDSEKLEKITQELYKEEFYRGIMNERCGEFEGLRVSQAKEGVIEKLSGMNLLSMIYENNIKDKDGTLIKEPKCRCGTALNIMVLPDQWFLDYGNTGWKDDTKQLLSEMKIAPELYRRGFEHTIGWLHEWPCTRNRGLGTRFPFDERWMIESLSDSTIYMAFYTIAHILNKGIPPEKLSSEFFDYVFLGLGDAKQVAAEMDVSLEKIKEMRKEFAYWYPMDERRTATAHISNHLTFMLFHHAAIFPHSLLPRKISLNEMLIAEGRKMSKSYGNVIPLRRSVEKYGADTVRLYLIYAADPETTLDWREAQAENTRRRVKQFYDMVVGVINLKEEERELSRDIDRWLLSRQQSIIKETRDSLDKSSARKAVQAAFYNTLGDLNWYFRRTGSPNRRMLMEYASVWVRLMAPFTPFTAEELWERLGNHDFVSQAKYPEPDEQKINVIVESQEQMIQNLIEDIREILEVTKKTPEKINLYVAPEWKYRVYEAIREGKTMKDVMQDSELKKHGKEVAKLMQTRKEALPQTILSREQDHGALKDARDFLAREYNCTIEVWTDASYDPEGKSKYAVPMKPGIYIE